MVCVVGVDDKGKVGGYGVMLLVKVLDLAKKGD